VDRWLDFIDRSFGDVDDLASWVTHSGLGIPGLAGGAAALSLAHQARAALTDLAAGLAGEQRAASGLAAVDAVLAAVPGRVRAGLGGVSFVADGPPLAQAVVAVVIEAAEFALRVDRPRVARCQRHECGRFFVDRSRDGRGRWCGAACGNVERVRRLRAQAD